MGCWSDGQIDCSAAGLGWTMAADDGRRLGRKHELLDRDEALNALVIVYVGVDVS